MGLRISVRAFGGRGGVAQLGERRVRNAKVEGSIPFRSTIYLSIRAYGRPLASMAVQYYTYNSVSYSQ